MLSKSPLLEELTVEGIVLGKADKGILKQLSLKVWKNLKLINLKSLYSVESVITAGLSKDTLILI